MGSCNSSISTTTGSRTSALLANFVAAESSSSFKSKTTNFAQNKKSKLSKTVSFLNKKNRKSKQQQQDQESLSFVRKTNYTYTKADEIRTNNNLPQIHLETYFNSLNNNNNREIEEYDNAVLDYNHNCYLTQEEEEEENIIYADEVSYPFPTVYDSNTITRTYLINETDNNLINNSDNNSTGNNTLSSNFESSVSSSSSSFRQLQMMHSSSASTKTNRFGFKPPSIPVTGVPVLGMQHQSSSNSMPFKTNDSINSTSSASSASTSMPNNKHERNKSPFRSFLPRPPATTTTMNTTNFKSNLPHSISNSISLSNNTNQLTTTNNNRTSGVSTNTTAATTTTNKQQSSSLSSLSSTTSSSLMNSSNDDNKSSINNIKIKSINSSPTKTKSSPSPSSTTNNNKKSSITTINTLSSSKILQINNANNNSKRRLFSPYTTNNTTNTTVTPAQTINNEAQSINLNQIFSNDYNNNNNKLNQATTTTTKSSQLKPPSTKLYTSKSTTSKMPVNNKLVNYSNNSPVKKDLSTSSSGGLIKREDSAYCSSTSSTVSSQDTELNKFPLSLNHQQQQQQQQQQSHPSNNEEETDSEFNHLDTDYTEDNLNAIDNLKQTIMNLDLKSSSNILNLDQISDLNFDLNKERNSVCSTNSSNNNKQRLNRQSSNIRDSFAELNHLSSTLTGNNTTNNNNNNNGMFRPPSNLPPAESSEIIQIDLDSFRLIMQDMQNTKMLLYKLSNILREPPPPPPPPTTSDTNNSDFNLLNEDFKSDDFIMTQSFMANNPLVSSFYNHVILISKLSLLI